MTSDHVRKLVLGGAIVGLAGWYGLSRWTPAESRAAAAGAPDDIARTLGELSATLEMAASSSALQLPDEAQWPPDPFFDVAQSGGAIPPGPAAPTRPELTERTTYVLTGIISGPCPLAMINGRLVGLGDQLAENVTVVAIHELSVSLREFTRTRILELPE